MSRAARGPQGRRSSKSARRAGPADQPCDCPVCSGEAPGPEQVIDAMLEGAADLAGSAGPLEAEMAGALFVAMAAGGGEPAFAGQLIPAIEAHQNQAALALLTMIAAAAGAGPESVAGAAREAAARLTAGGVPEPGWAHHLRQPLEPGSFTRLYDTTGSKSVLAGSFRRAGHEDAIVILVDHEHCGAADDILVLDGADLPDALRSLRDSAHADGLTVETRRLSAAEFRWYAEEAMAARADHDAEDAEDGAAPELLDEQGGPGYLVHAVPARTRLASLPEPRRPRGAAGTAHNVSGVPLADLLQFAQAAASGSAPAGRVQQAKRPARRTKQAGPAAAYQLKVSLRGARPPIWRRLLVPADITLAGLHTTIGVAFDWHGGHMHVFETAYGDFGRADRELGHRADSSVTLERVAPDTGSRFRYTYDFGDDWIHDILVEKILPPDPAAELPRCTGGRRAAPPDDCGGIWGYEELMATLADPAQPDHHDRLAWLGLTDAGQFTPETFDLPGINARLRGRNG